MTSSSAPLSPRSAGSDIPSASIVASKSAGGASSSSSAYVSSLVELVLELALVHEPHADLVLERRAVGRGDVAPTAPPPPRRSRPHGRGARPPRPTRPGRRRPPARTRSAPRAPCRGGRARRAARWAGRRSARTSAPSARSTGSHVPWRPYAPQTQVQPCVTTGPAPGRTGCPRVAHHAPGHAVLGDRPRRGCAPRADGAFGRGVVVVGVHVDVRARLARRRVGDALEDEVRLAGCVRPTTTHAPSRQTISRSSSAA